jgi:hypothetical protein
MGTPVKDLAEKRTPDGLSEAAAEPPGGNHWGVTEALCVRWRSRSPNQSVVGRMSASHPAANRGRAWGA